MEPFSSIVLYLAAIALPLGIAGHRALLDRRTRERAASWDRLARRLGMSFRDGAMVGRHQEQNVTLSIEMRSNGESNGPSTIAECIFGPAFDLGLVVRRRGLLNDVVRAFGGGKDHPIGDLAFDRACRVKVDEPPRAARLLTPRLRTLLVAIDDNEGSYLLTDAGIRIESPGAIADERWLEWAIRVVAEIGREVEETRSRIPPATPLLAYRDQFRRYADETGLRVLDAPLRMFGRMKDVQVLIHAERVGPLEYQLEITVKFDKSLNRGLRVHPAGTLDDIGHLFGGATHQLGDQAFDRAFVVRGSGRAEIAAILDEDLRKRLLDVHQRVGQVEVRDDGFYVCVLPLGPPASVPGLVEEAKEVALRVVRNARLGAGPKLGPYR